IFQKQIEMLVYKDAFTGDVLCTEECPVTTVDDFVYEFTGRVSIRSGDSIVPEDDFNGDGFDEVGIDFVLRHKLAPTGKQISSLDEFINTYGKSIVEQVTKAADFGGDEEAFSNQAMSWASGLFEDADRASKIQFYASPNFVEGERGQICLVEFRGEQQVPTLILLKAATVTEEHISLFSFTTALKQTIYEMKCYKDGLNGDILFKTNLPPNLVDDLIYEFTVDFNMEDHLVKQPAVDSYDEFMTAYGVRQFEMVNNKLNKEAFNPESMAFAGKFMTWVLGLFEDEERAKNLEFWCGKSPDGLLCFVEKRGDKQVLMVLKEGFAVFFSSWTVFHMKNTEFYADKSRARGNDRSASSRSARSTAKRCRSSASSRTRPMAVTMKYFDDKLNGDILCTGNCPIKTAEGIILELTVDDKLLSKHLVKKEDITNYDQFMAASNKGGKDLDSKFKTWLKALFANPDRNKNLEFWTGPTPNGQICIVERRGEERVPILMLTKDLTKIEERSNSMMTGPHQPDNLQANTALVSSLSFFARFAQ
ncbi:hypothetical protein PRIPAC_90637, partial [Pristionchus pacificus]|uniref:TCTP domain-containing protein n=1 Tax=Pristionchus pacificus TaxID=54126 RepID=A0A2A6CWV2_PRIPA